jgi:hypothetical protein
VASVLALCALTVLGLASTASATDLQCGDTVTQDTVLTSDVVCATGENAGVVVGGDNLTLWLNGHKIQGPGVTGLEQSAGVVDDGTPHTGVVVRGGSISGFDFGIDLQVSNGALKGLALTSTDRGILVAGDDNYLLLNQMSSPGTLALEADGDRNYLWGNVIGGDPDDGISVDGQSPLIVLNQVASCTFTGITVSGYTAAKIARNTVSGCDTGIDIIGQHAKLQSNETSGNSYGLFVEDPSALVRFNTANDNTVEGIATGVAGATLGQNTANNNVEYGIDAVLGTIDGGGNRASGNGIDDRVVVVCTP